MSKKENICVGVIVFAEEVVRSGLVLFRLGVLGVMIFVSVVVVGSVQGSVASSVNGGVLLCVGEFKVISTMLCVAFGYATVANERFRVVRTGPVEVRIVVCGAGSSSIVLFRVGMTVSENDDISYYHWYSTT